MKRLKIQKLTETAKLPTKGSKYAAGWDLYADISQPLVIAPHTTSLINTGIAIELPVCTFGAIYPRSGISVKRDLNLANCVAVIDEDYRGEVKIAIHNNGDNYQEITPGERIAQLVIQPYTPVSILERKELSKTKRGNGGFGSTGRK
jgi:dUTP pyrophosphatase